MATMRQLRQMMLQKYELESELMRLESSRNELENRARQCRYEKRQAEQALTEYEMGGFRPWLDKLTGRFEERRETAARALRAADAALAAAQRELSEHTVQMENAKAELEPLAQQGDPLELAQHLPPEEAEAVSRLEAGLCARKLIRVLEENRTALENAQEFARPEAIVGEGRNMQKNLYYAQADGFAASCMEYMERIALCGILMEIHPYFMNPTGYIVGVAAPYGQLDRINSALGAIREAREQAAELIRQLLDA